MLRSHPGHPSPGVHPLHHLHVAVLVALLLARSAKAAGRRQEAAAHLRLARKLKART